MEQDDQLQELLEICQRDNRICPSPIRWNQFWELLGSPCDKVRPPLILSAGMFSSGRDKRKCFLKQVRYAADSGRLQRARDFIMRLTDREWQRCSNDNLDWNYGYEMVEAFQREEAELEAKLREWREMGKRVFPAQRVECSSTRGLDPSSGRMTERKNEGGYFVVEEAAADFIDEILGDHVRSSAFYLMNLTEDPQAWAAVFFSDIIKNADEVLDARAELRDDIAFAAYGKAEVGIDNPALGAMVVKNPEALRVASSRHEIFQKAWDALQSCSPNRNWVAIVVL
jgi:hypothetical protein